MKHDKCIHFPCLSWNNIDTDGRVLCIPTVLRSTQFAMYVYYIVFSFAQWNDQITIKPLSEFFLFLLLWSKSVCKPNTTKFAGFPSTTANMFQPYYLLIIRIGIGKKMEKATTSSKNTKKMSSLTYFDEMHFFPSMDVFFSLTFFCCLLQ